MIRMTRLALLFLGILSILLSIFAQVKWQQLDDPLSHAAHLETWPIHYVLLAQVRCFLFGKPQCETPTLCDGCMCNLLLSPVCGSNGKTYSNACRAKADCQFKWTQGACPTEE